MDLCVLDPSHGGYVSVESQQQQYNNEKTLSRTPSPASSIDDIFSVTSEASSQSSNGDSEDDFHNFQRNTATATEQQACAGAEFSKPSLPAALHPSQLQNPRRSFSSTKRAPPPLPRQEERKVLFVNDLVDSATNLVSVIWPLSSLPCGQSTGNKGVLPLRRYIEETLRRSRTSYSTLQVALYYLILIKSHVPRNDFTMEQSADCASMRAMQCGRRMFLAALILASKYLQDRNYSAKAWSKMSGLKTTEINGNERMFLSAVSWKLHIPDHIFKRWTDIVLQFTAQPGLASPSCGIGLYDSKNIWARLIPLLTPTLDDPRILALALKTRPQPDLSGLQATATFGPAPTPTLATYSPSISQESTPTPASIVPRFLDTRTDLPPTPGLVRMGNLPTPAMTPSSIASSTPAVSACSSRRPSMSIAMSQVQHNTIGRITSDRPPTSCPLRSSSLRMPSVAPSLLSCSSPESMITDMTRSSRSSSISSVATASTGAPHRAFARPVIHRSSSGASMTIDPSKLSKDGTADRPITILDDLPASPESDFFPLSRENRKRCRSRPSSSSDSDLQAQVRSLLAGTNAMDLDLDDDVRVAEDHVPAAELRRAMAGIKGLQSPCAGGMRVPLVVGGGRKRVCSERVPDVYVEVGRGIWEGVE